MINTKLQSIIDTKSAIGNAIVNKGGTITGETPFFNYAAQIDSIEVGGASVIEYTNAGSITSPAGVISKITNPDNLSQQKSIFGSGTINGFALFAGGFNGSTLNTVDVYNSSLTRSTATNLSVARYRVAGASINGYVLFASGFDGTNESNVVDVYNSSLTRSTATNLSVARQQVKSSTVGNFALFAGGTGALNTVDAYNTSLTRSTPTVLSVGRADPIGAKNENYALFAGGFNGSGGSNTVDAYNSSLTRSTGTLTSNKQGVFGANIGVYALFAGGFTGTASNTVDAFNGSLTRTSATNLAVGRGDGAAETLSQTILAGGIIDYGSFTTSNVVESYNTSLTRSNITSLTVGARNQTPISFNGYILIAGGSLNSGRSNAVEAYFESPNDVYSLTAPTLSGFNIVYNYSFNDLGVGTVNSGQTLNQNSAFTGTLELPETIS
jgi:hypothetical protein